LKVPVFNGHERVLIEEAFRRALSRARKSFVLQFDEIDDPSPIEMTCMV
jgi:hypothetical protein